MDIVAILSIFVLACVAGGHVVRAAAPAAHAPLIAMTGAISSIVIVGALIVATASGSGASSGWLGLLAVVLASAGLFGGFALVRRMLATSGGKEPPAAGEP